MPSRLRSSAGAGATPARPHDALPADPEAGLAPRAPIFVRDAVWGTAGWALADLIFAALSGASIPFTPARRLGLCVALGVVAAMLRLLSAGPRRRAGTAHG